MKGGKARRRIDGQGSVSPYETRSGTRYRAQWWEVTPGGDPIRHGKAGFTTKKAAAMHAAQAMSLVRQGHSLNTNVTVREYMNKYLAEARNEASTLAGYRRYARLHVYPYIGNVRLSDLRPSALSGLYQKLETSGRRDAAGNGGPLSKNSVLKVHQLLSVVLAHAVAERLIPENPAQNKAANPPRPKEVKQEQRAQKKEQVWTRAELTRFLAWAQVDAPDIYPVWYLVSQTGLRRSEVAGMLWQDVDWKNNQLVIVRAEVAVRDKGQKGIVVEKGTKTDNSREVDLDPLTLSLLRKHFETARETNPSTVAAESHVFRLASGGKLTPDRLTDRWQHGVERFNRQHKDLSVPRISFHGLRHTHASHLFAAGIPPKVVQERLGHATLAITMDLYTHLMPKVKAEAMTSYTDWCKAEDIESGRND